MEEININGISVLIHPDELIKEFTATYGHRFAIKSISAVNNPQDPGAESIITGICTPANGRNTASLKGLNIFAVCFLTRQLYFTIHPAHFACIRDAVTVEYLQQRITPRQL